MTKTQKNLYELRLLHRESQILALQSQINPHFLYNTLECVRSIAQTYRVPKSPKVLSAMIHLSLQRFEKQYGYHRVKCNVAKTMRRLCRFGLVTGSAFTSNRGSDDNFCSGTKNGFAALLGKCR